MKLTAKEKQEKKFTGREDEGGGWSVIWLLRVIYCRLIYPLSRYAWSWSLWMLFLTILLKKSSMSKIIFLCWRAISSKTQYQSKRLRIILWEEFNHVPLFRRMATIITTFGTTAMLCLPMCFCWTIWIGRASWYKSLQAFVHASRFSFSYGKDRRYYTAGTLRVRQRIWSVCEP